MRRSADARSHPDTALSPASLPARARKVWREPACFKINDSRHCRVIRAWGRASLCRMEPLL